jgi:hypothetical protein
MDDTVGLIRQYATCSSVYLVLQYFFAKTPTIWRCGLRLASLASGLLRRENALNHRKWPRFNLILSVQVRFQQRADMTTTRTLNISRSGLFLALERPRPIGTPVRVNLSIAETGEQFALEGIVVHRQPDENQPLPPGATAGNGVFLTRISPEYERFCDELAADKAAPAGKTPRHEEPCVRR